jgi:D-aminoacyl-tRNA deacylase
MEGPIPDVEWLLFLTQHRSSSGMRCLTAHTPGNLTGRSDLGGRPREVAISNPPLQSRLIVELQRIAGEMGLDCPVTLEATHHGPTSLPFPVTFVEIGSDPDAWGDDSLGEAVARAVHRAVSSPLPSDLPGGRCGMGVGGGHYPEKFTRLITEEGWLLGHIIPKYAMQGGMDASLLETCMERTAVGCSSIAIDWKGTPSVFRESLKTLAQTKGIELVKV